MSDPKVLAVIPARGGSKGLLRKNLKLLQGHPLVAWAIAAALESCKVTRTMVSTDDAEIAEVARRYGAEVPFMRPVELAEDQTLDLPVYQHVLHQLEKAEAWRPSLVVQLRPTSPIRLPGMVDAAVAMLEQDPQATSVRSVCPAPCNPHKMWRLPAENGRSGLYMENLLNVPGVPEPFNAPRQILPPVWWQTGALDIVRSEIILGGSMTGGRILPFKMPAQLAVDIDGNENLRLAELIVDGLTCVRPGPSLDWRVIKLLVVDIDGTLTPGTLYYDSEGERLKRFHTHDGKGLARVREAGVEVVIATEETTGFTQARAKKLGITEVYVGIRNKLQLIHSLAERKRLRLAEIAYVGDDLGDLTAMRAIGEAGGIPCAVSDARPEIKDAARYLCHHPGGAGAVRDVCDRIMAVRQQSS